MMIESPSVVVAASQRPRRGDRRELMPPEAAAAESTVTRIIAHYRRSCPAQRQPPPLRDRRATSRSPSHRGLGSGTQLGMSVAQALAFLARRRAGRRSYARPARRPGQSLGDRHSRLCTGWISGRRRKTSGGRDRSIGRSGRFPRRLAIALDHARCIVRRRIGRAGGGDGTRQVARDAGDAHRTALPAGRAGDAPRRRRSAIATGLAKPCFNSVRSVGEYFRPVQGGPYADPLVTELVGWLRSVGVRGVAQTSWGPTIAVCCPTGPSPNPCENEFWRTNAGQTAACTWPHR